MKSVIFALSLVIASPAVAEPSSPSPATSSPGVADPAALAAAERMMDAMNYDKLIDDMMTAMVAQARLSIPEQIEKMAEQAGEELPADFKERLVAIVVGSLERSTKGKTAELRRDTALIYARHFTAAEIDRMTELQKDPVMVKMQAKMPAIMAESMAMSQKTLAEEMPRMIEDVKQMVAEYKALQEKDGS